VSTASISIDWPSLAAGLVVVLAAPLSPRR
jgi:hypothetical protein